MKRIVFYPLLALVLVLAVLLGAALATAMQPRSATASYLPIVTSQQPITSVCPEGRPLLDQDTGLLSADYRNGYYTIAFQDRAHGSRAVVMRHVGDRLVDEPGPPPGRLSGIVVGPAPAFSPDGRKQGDLSLVQSGPKSRLYYTQRVEDDTPNEGPYALWCIEW